MANNITKVKTAAGKTYRKESYHRNLTTAGFMQFQPLFYKECIPFAKLKGRFQIWSRCNPLVLPTMGIVNYHYKRYFVRYKDIWQPWDDFYNKAYHVGSNGVSGFVTKVPRLTMSDIWNIFNTGGYISTVVPSGSQPDFTYVTYQGTSVPALFTNKGRALIKIFQSLGYNFSWNYNDPIEYNVLPLMALGKIYIDYYFPKQYTMLTSFQNVKKLFNLNIINYVSSDSTFFDGIKAICSLLSLGVFYDGDGYYNAWNNPVGPSEPTSMVGTTFEDNTIDHGSLIKSDPTERDTEGTPYLTLTDGGGSAVSGITKFGIKMLGALSDLVKRYQLAGNESVERFFARFGLPLTDSHRAIKIGEDIVPVRIGDVESNSDSSVTIDGTSYNSVLGDLAGKGVGSGSGKFVFRNDSHFGIMLGVFSVVPDAGLYQGIDRTLLHVSPEHFYNPEFDGKGVSLITDRELFNSIDGSINTVAHLNHPFGFLPMGYENVLGRNILSGLFRLSNNAGLDAYHTYRNLNVEFQGGDIEVGINFTGSSDKRQYNRIFYNNNEIDQFIVRFRSVFEEDSTKLPLSESYEWEEGDGKFVNVSDGVKDN